MWRRSFRAGLGAVSHNTGGVEPRGDLDVMLSMRAQGLFPSNPDSTSPIATLRVQSPISLSPTSPSHSTFANDYSVSPPSTLSRSHSRSGQNSSNGNGNVTTTPLSTPKMPIVAVSALKGLFSSRPRSPSAVSMLSTEIDHSQHSHSHAEVQDESFGSVGQNLLTFRSQTVSSDTRFSPQSPTFSTSSMTPSTPRKQSQSNYPTQSPQQVQEGRLLDRKILRDGDRQLQLADWNPSTSFNSRTSFIRGESDANPSVSSSSSTTPIGTGSPSLQPPPRRRAWTSGGPGNSSSKDSESRNVFSGNSYSAYPYSHANGSTAESLGVKHPYQNGTLSPSFMMAPTPNANTTPTAEGHKKTKDRERKTRMSWSSVSTQASGEVTPADNQHGGSGGLSNGSSLGRRWSRHGTFSHRLTPPTGSPNSSAPSPHSHSNQQTPRNSTARHPYAAERPPSRSSSLRSSPQSLVLDLRPLSPKRASGSSVQSFTTGSSHSRSPGLFSSPRSGSTHRVSIPPPQRPAPLSALPPTPGDDLLSASSQGSTSTATPVSILRPPQSAPATKTSFRDTLTLRAHRLSLSPPSKPPSSTLPPRPDEPGFNRPQTHHRRTASNGSVGNGSPLATIPASPTPMESSPYPPPNGPLPPTPIFSSSLSGSLTPVSSIVSPTGTTMMTTTSTNAPTPTRPTLSIKRRLRILSAPTPSPPSTPDLSASSQQFFTSSASPLPPQQSTSFQTPTSATSTSNSSSSSCTPAVSALPTSPFDASSYQGMQSQSGSVQPVSLGIPADSSVPPTPIGGPITTFQNDPNFLLMSPPTPPLPPNTPSAMNGNMNLPLPLRTHIPISSSLHHHSHHHHHRHEMSDHDSPGVITSLSPPPRRGSRRISTSDKEKLLGVGSLEGVGEEGKGKGRTSGVSLLAILKDDILKDEVNGVLGGGGVFGVRELQDDEEQKVLEREDGNVRVDEEEGLDPPTIHIHDSPEPEYHLPEEEEEEDEEHRDHEHEHHYHEGEEEEQKNGVLSSAASAFGLDLPKTRPLDHRCAVSLVDVSL